MSHTCNRCRTVYESGSFYGGHDYCMSCYVAVRQEEESKKRREEAVRQEALDKQRREQERKILEGELAKKAAAIAARKKEEKYAKEYFAAGIGAKTVAERKRKNEEEAKKRKQYDDWKQRLEAIKRAREAQQEEAQPQNARRRVRLGEPQVVQQQDGFEAGHTLSELVIEGPSAPKKKRMEFAAGRLELAVKKGLPVSLSIGQKKNKVSFSASNITAKEAHVKLFASAADSQGKQVELKISPQECAIEPNGAGEFEAEFDLGEGCAKGNFKLSAYAKEKAVYLDAAMGKSNVVEMETNVKTPMQLVYRKGSVEFEEGAGALMLEFDNIGESGGILSAKSKIAYGAQKASLAKQAKIKGYEREIKLEFENAKKEKAQSFKITLVGVDSNGKEYALEREIKEEIG